MNEEQRQAWKDALAAKHKQNRGDRGRRYRGRRTGLAALDGAGRIRITPRPVRKQGR